MVPIRIPSPHRVTRYLRSHASDKILLRAVHLAAQGRVVDLEERASGWIHARVQGSGPTPWSPRVRIRGERIQAHCDCPFDWEPVCKHSAAVLLATAGDSAVGLLRRRLSREGRTFLAARQAQLAARCERGRSPELRVQLESEPRLPAVFSVAGSGERRYEVRVRHRLRPVNGCDCPDFQVNMLGTCKHLEAALAWLDMNAPVDHPGDLPEVGRVVVRRDDVPRVSILPPRNPSAAAQALRAEFFDGDGTLHGPPCKVLPQLTDRLSHVPDVVIEDEVHHFLESVLRDDEARAREDHVRRELSGLAGTARALEDGLLPYQEKGVAFLAGRGRALLADELGLGKTLQAVAAARHLVSRGDVERILVICPGSRTGHWLRAFAARGSGRREFKGAVLAEGPPLERSKIYGARPATLVVRYERAARDHDALAEGAPDLMIVDQAQRLHNWKSKTASRIKRIPARYVFVLAGASIERRPEALYSLLQLVDSRVLGPLWSFHHRFIEPGGDPGARRGELRRRLAPVVLRRTRADVSGEVAVPLETRHYVDLPEPPLSHGAPLAPGEASPMETARRRLARINRFDSGGATHPKLSELGRIVGELGPDPAPAHSGEGRMLVFCSDPVGRAAALGVIQLAAVPCLPEEGMEESAALALFAEDPNMRVLVFDPASGPVPAAEWHVHLDVPLAAGGAASRVRQPDGTAPTGCEHIVHLIARNSLEARLREDLAELGPDADLAASILDVLRTIPIPGSVAVDGAAPAGEGATRPATSGPTDGEARHRGAPTPVDQAELFAPTDGPSEYICDPECQSQELEQVLAEASRAGVVSVWKQPHGRWLVIVNTLNPSLRNFAKHRNSDVISAATHAELAALGPHSPYASVQPHRVGSGNGRLGERAGRGQDRMERRLSKARALLEEAQSVLRDPPDGADFSPPSET